MASFRVTALLVLICLVSAPAAWAFRPTDFVYFPGCVSYRVALKTFSAPGMAPACDLLKQERLTEAEPLFRAQTQRHPDDLTAWIGFLQAARGHRDQLLPQYQQEAAASPTEANEFKLGLLAFYMYGETYTNLGKPPTLPNLAREHLKRAYEMTYSPVAGLALASCHWYTHPDHSRQVYETMIFRLAGEKIYQDYVHARDHNWAGPQPDVPLLSRDKMYGVRYAVGYLIFIDSGRIVTTETRRVNGRNVKITRESPLTPFQTVGERLLNHKPDDNDVKYYLIQCYKPWRSTLEKQKAVSLAQDLVHVAPSRPGSYSALGGVYFNSWMVSHEKEDAEKAVLAYRHYLRVAPQNYAWRRQAESIIQYITSHSATGK